MFRAVLLVTAPAASMLFPVLLALLLPFDMAAAAACPYLSGCVVVELQHA